LAGTGRALFWTGPVQPLHGLDGHFRRLLRAEGSFKTAFVNSLTCPGTPE